MLSAGLLISMRHKYNITFSVDLGAFIPEVGDLCNSVNETMQGFGFHEKMGLRSECINTALTVNEKLTQEQETKITSIMIQQFEAAQPTWKVKLESFKYEGPTTDDDK